MATTDETKGTDEIKVQIYFNIHADHFDGYQPGHPLMKVFDYTIDPAGRSAEALAEQAFRICNGAGADAAERQLGEAYYAERVRSLSAGDVVIVGEAPLACTKAGWVPAEQITFATGDQARHARESTGWCLPAEPAVGTHHPQTRTGPETRTDTGLSGAAGPPGPAEHGEGGERG